VRDRHVTAKGCRESAEIALNIHVERFKAHVEAHYIHPLIIRVWDIAIESEMHDLMG